MKAIRLTLIIGAVLVSASPAFSQFVKAALGFRLGYSPTERGYGQKPVLNIDNKKAVGVQLLTGVNSGGWQAEGRQLTSGSAYGVGIPRDGALQAHTGNSAVRHLRILGLNLYLGGKAAHALPAAGHGHGGGWKQPLAAPYKKPFSLFPLKPLLALPTLGLKVKPTISAHAGPHSVGGGGSLRASIGTPGYGVGFNVGYRQGFNIKSPLALALGLGGPKYYGPRGYAPVHKGHDHVYVQGASLKGHGHDVAHVPLSTGHNALLVDNSIVTGLESKQHLTAQPLPVQHQQQHVQQVQPEQQAQASQTQPQQQQIVQPQQQHQGLQGPFHPPARPSIFNLFGLASHSRPTILRPTPIQYSFNNPQPLASTNNNNNNQALRLVAGHHPPTPAPQSPRANPPNEVSPQQAGWSTLFPVVQQQTAASTVHAFVNPLPPNGQSLSRLQASLRGPLTSAQHQIPYYQPAPQYSFGFPRGGLFGRSIRPRSPAPPQFAPSYNLFQHNYQAPYQQYLPQQQRQQQSLIPQQSLYIGQQSLSTPSQVQAAPQQSPHNLAVNFPTIPQLPFTADSIQFSPDPSFQYSHSTSSQPINMGSYTMNMNLGSGNSGEQASAASTPVFGPGGRRIKKLKKTRQDVIIKKQDTPSKDMMDASATNTITMASSLGSTQWTPLVFVDIPKISRKSDSPQRSVLQHEVLGSASALIPTVVIAPEEHNQDRSMILKRRRLGSSAEGEGTAQTVIPPTDSSTTTTTTTPAPTPSSSSSPPEESAVTTVNA